MLALFAAALLATTVSSPPKDQRVESRRLAILIASHPPAERAMHNDLIAFSEALAARGLSVREQRVLEGEIDREGVLGFLRRIADEIAAWRQGEVLLFYTGHGTYTLQADGSARPALELRPASTRDRRPEPVYWDEAFDALRVPRAVRLVVLPDT
jgi:hypothetical protein